MAERINCPAPLLEDPEVPLLMKMLFPVPYEVPEKKDKKKAKGTRDGLRCKGALDAVSEDAENHSSVAEDDDEEEEEEEEIHSRPAGGRKNRMTSTHLEAEASKKGKVPFRTAPQRLPTAAGSGSLGRSPWPNRKCPNTFMYPAFLYYCFVIF